MIMVSMYLPSDVLLYHLPSYLGFCYLGRGVSLHGCSSRVQPLLLTLDEVAPPDLERGVAPLGPPVPATPWMWGCSSWTWDFPDGSDGKASAYNAGESESESEVVSDSLQPHGLQPTRFLHPWDFPGKSTGVECHCLLRVIS